jgi:hypothetical protein
MTQTIDIDKAKQHRQDLIEAFDRHDEVDENEDELYEDEVFPDAPDDIVLQKVVACYDGAMVWVLNEDGPLQVWYTETDEWGERTGGSAMSDYDSAVVQLQDGRELYLRDLSSGPAGLTGRCNDTRNKVHVKSDNIALVIWDVPLHEYNDYIDGNEELVVTGRWDE